LLKLGTWFAMVLEFSLGALIWIKRIRYKVLFAGLIFHLWLEYSLNIPMFQWDILTGYLLFVDAEDYRRAWGRVSGWWAAKILGKFAVGRLRSWEKNYHRGDRFQVSLEQFAEGMHIHFDIPKDGAH
jgi:hypothetical protein